MKSQLFLTKIISEKIKEILKKIVKIIIQFMNNLWKINLNKNQ